MPKNSTLVSIHQQRNFLGFFFFFAGVGFSSWASRIPTIKANFHLNDAELGTLLLLLPISSLIGLPISGWLVSRFNSRYPLAAAFILNSLAIIAIGFAHSLLILSISVFLFAFSTRILNISVNTQAVTLQNQFEKPITGIFHGLWSAGGVFGISFTTLMLNYNVPINYHLLMIGATIILMTALCYSFLIKNDKPKSGNKLIIGKPDPFILSLGLLAFFAAVCEGGMFDWSGIYFKEVIKTPIYTYGYLIFMSFMAGFRFISGKVILKVGIATNYIISSVCILSGILLAVIFPNFWCGLIGFSLVGIGTASIVPMTYGLAGKSKKYSPGMAISIITTYTIFGMLIGPPIIGYLSHALNLRISFMMFALAGFMISPVSYFFFKNQFNKQS